LPIERLAARPVSRTRTQDTIAVVADASQMRHRLRSRENFLIIIRAASGIEGFGARGKVPMRALDRLDDTEATVSAAEPHADGLVARARLLDQLEQAPRGALLWITAGPGAGKTALAATWAKTRWAGRAGADVLWYDVDEIDSDPLRFCATVGGFLGLPHGFGADIPPHPTPEAFAEIAEAARRWLQAPRQAGGEGSRLLVFDDVHRAPADAVTIAFLPLLAEALRPEDRILCLSRRSPPWPVAEDPISAPRLALFADLHVQPEEFPDFARDLPGGQALSCDLFLAGVQRSGGWISEMLPFAWQHMLPGRMAEAAGLGPEDMAGDRRVLLTSAFLQRGHSAEWEALAGPDAVTLLSRLARAGGLVSRLPDGTLRKHDAFHAALMRDAEADLPPAALNEARRKTAALLGRRQEVLSAVRLLIAAGDPDGASRLVLETAAAMSLAGQNQDIEDAIGLLPDDLAGRPLQRIWLAFARSPYEPREAQRRLSEIRQSLQPETSPVEYALALGCEARAVLSDFFDFHELPRLVEEMDRVLPRLEVHPAAERQRLLLTRCISILIGWPTHPEVEQARHHLEAVLPFLPATAQLMMGGVLINYLIWWRGDVAAARPFLDHLEATARRPDMAPLAVMTWYYGALSCAYRDGDDDALRRLTDEVVAFAGAHGVSHRLTNAFWIVTQAYASGGDPKAAAAMLERYAACAQERWRRTDFIGRHHLRSFVALCGGDTAMAIAEAEQALGYAKRYGGPHQTANQDLLLAMASAIDGSAAARPHVDELRRVASLTGNATFLLHANLAEALLELADGRGAVAAALWNRVADAACRLGVRRIAGLGHPRLPALANDALAHGADPGLTRRTIGLWRLAPPEGVVHDLWPFSAEIRTLGGFRVEKDGARTTMGSSKAQRKPMELLWCLVAGPAEGMAQETLADQLWPELDGDRALHNLRTTIYRLRKLIGGDALLHEDNRVGLAADQVRTDIGRLRVALALMRDRTVAPADRLSAFDLTLRLYRGPFLPGIRLAPVEEERDRIRRLLVMEGVELLLAQDPRDPATAFRASRLRAIAPGVQLPPALAALLPS
jgi:ATP/maltotriose-dependent transcriptional regulator MalT